MKNYELRKTISEKYNVPVSEKGKVRENYLINYLIYQEQKLLSYGRINYDK